MVRGCWWDLEGIGRVGGGGGGECLAPGISLGAESRRFPLGDEDISGTLRYFPDLLNPLLLIVYLRNLGDVSWVDQVLHIFLATYHDRRLGSSPSARVGHWHTARTGSQHCSNVLDRQ